MPVDDTVPRALRLLLLERAVLTVYEAHGIPTCDADETWFQNEVSVVYLAFLVARRSAPPRSFIAQARELTERAAYLKRHAKTK